MCNAQAEIPVKERDLSSSRGGQWSAEKRGCYNATSSRHVRAGWFMRESYISHPHALATANTRSTLPWAHAMTQPIRSSHEHEVTFEQTSSTSSTWVSVPAAKSFQKAHLRLAGNGQRDG